MASTKAVSASDGVGPGVVVWNPILIEISKELESGTMTEEQLAEVWAIAKRIMKIERRCVECGVSEVMVDSDGLFSEHDLCELCW